MYVSTAHTSTSITAPQNQPLAKSLLSTASLLPQKISALTTWKWTISFFSLYMCTLKHDSLVFPVLELGIEYKLSVPLCPASSLYMMVGRFIKVLSGTIVHWYSCIFHYYMITNDFPFHLLTLGWGLLAMVCLWTFPYLSLGVFEYTHLQCEKKS